jgi:hypothetical protein
VTDKIRVTAKPFIIDENTFKVEQVVTSDICGRTAEQVSTMIVCVGERAIAEGLMALGWTPPPGWEPPPLPALAREDFEDGERPSIKTVFSEENPITKPYWDKLVAAHDAPHPILERFAGMMDEGSGP